jgi:hypothetical protein
VTTSLRHDRRMDIKLELVIVPVADRFAAKDINVLGG